MTRGRYWKDGKCPRGHDVTNPGNIKHRKDGFRQCRVCLVELKRRRRQRPATVARIAPEDKPEPAPPKDRQPTASETAKILALYRRAEDEAPWVAQATRQLAERIRQFGLPTADRSEARNAYARAQWHRLRDGVTKRAPATRDRPPHVVDRAVEPSCDGCDGGPPRRVDPPAPQAAQMRGADADLDGCDFERDPRAVEVQQGV